MAKGGVRAGAGRKTIAEEVNSRELAMSALIMKYGSREEALKSLLDSGNPILMKFVYEHGFGKPIEKVAEVDSEGRDKLPLVIKL